MPTFLVGATGRRVTISGNEEDQDGVCLGGGQEDLLGPVSTGACGVHKEVLALALAPGAVDIF